MRSALPALAVITVLFGWPARLAAEPTLYLLVFGISPLGCVGEFCAPSRIVEIDVARGQITGEYPIAASGRRLFVTPDGSTLVWANRPDTGSSMLQIFDTANRASFVVRPWGYDTEPELDPTSLRAVAASFNSLVVIDPNGQRNFPFPPGCSVGQLYRGLSLDATRALVQCGNPARTVTMDTVTGAVVHTMPGTFFYLLVRLNERGDELYAVDSSSNNGRVMRFDVATNTELASFSYTFPFGTGHPGEPFIERRTGRLFLVRTNEILAFNPSTLALIARVPLPAQGSATAAQGFVFDPNRPRGYLLQHSGSTDNSRLTIIDTETVSVLFSTILPYSVRLSVRDIVLAAAPPAPIDLAATTTGRTVTLNWAPGQATYPAVLRYTIEAGSASGQANLAVLPTPGRGTTFTATNVPPGTYYVRVKAVNATGASAPSNEVIVTVQ